MKLSTTAVLAALVFLGHEPVEGEDPQDQLTELLAEFNLEIDQFMTKETMFACGFHRGLNSASYDPLDQVPQIDLGDGKTGPAPDLEGALQEGYAIGLEARDMAKVPPPSVVYAAFEAQELTWGQFADWASKQDLTETKRLGTSITVGSGKEAVTVPAGTPVDVIDSIEKDGVPHVIVCWDGLPLLVPNADDAPSIVSGDTDVAPEKKRRSSSGKKGTGAKKEKADKGPTLRQVIIEVIEGDPGPLQNDGAFAGKVLQRCTELGIRDKAGRFVQKASHHVPYYLNSYKPAKGDVPGRLGIENPLDSIVAAIEARKYFLKGGLEAIPEDLRKRIDDKEARYATVAPPPTPAKSDKKDDGEKE